MRELKVLRKRAEYLLLTWLQGNIHFRHDARTGGGTMHESTAEVLLQPFGGGSGRPPLCSSLEKTPKGERALQQGPHQTVQRSRGWRRPPAPLQSAPRIRSVAATY